MGNIGSRVEKGKPAAPPPPAGDKAKLYRSRFELHNNTLALLAIDADDTICSPATGITQERDEAAAYVVLKRNAKAQVMVMAALQSRPHGNQQTDMVPAVRQELYCAQKGGVNCCLASLLSPRPGQDEDCCPWIPTCRSW